MTKAAQTLHKAVLLLSRGDRTRGEATLREAVARSEGADPVTQVAALCCLGEVLLAQDRIHEAADALRACLNVGLDPDLDDVCADELDRARQLLNGIDGHRDGATGSR